MLNRSYAIRQFLEKISLEKTLVNVKQALESTDFKGIVRWGNLTLDLNTAKLDGLHTDELSITLFENNFLKKKIIADPLPIVSIEELEKALIHCLIEALQRAVDQK